MSNAQASAVKQAVRLPNLLYIGMGKSGSTLLYKMFLRNPDIYVSPKFKELNFFGNNKRWREGIEWYEECFKDCKNERWVADVSPGYHAKDITRERIQQTLQDDLKLIFTFRRFTDFAYSRYLQKVRSRMLGASFLDELEGKGNFFRPLDEILPRYFNKYGRENFLIMQYESDFDRKNPQFEGKINDFLDLQGSSSYYETTSDKGVNKGCIPRFVWSGETGYEEEVDGIIYSVPPKTMVYCSGRGYRNRFWTNPSKTLIDENRAIEKRWTTEMNHDLYQYVQENYTMPLAERIQNEVGIDLSHWKMDSKEIRYSPAPLPDAYIVEGQEVSLETTPWG